MLAPMPNIDSKTLCGLSPFPLCGFPRAVYRLSEPPKPLDHMVGKGWGSFNVNKKVRIQIIPKSKAKHITNKPKQTKNRKHISFKQTQIYDGVEYNVDVRKSGIYTSMMRKFMSQLNICQSRWGRVFVVRFDLRQQFHTKDNRYVTRFMDNLKKRLRRQYGINEVGYVWSREQEKSKNQHYHGAIFLDASKVRYGVGVGRIITATWENIERTNSAWIPTDGFYFMDSHEIKADVVFRISYMAKGRGKGYRPPQTKDYSTSRLTHKTGLK